MTDGAANSPKTGTGRHKLPTELETPLPAALYLNLKSVRRRICGHGAQRGANRTPSASLSAAAPPSNSGRGFQRRGPHLRPPSPGEGFQRERAAALALRVVGGPGRSRNALVLFFRGVGRVLFQKRMRPTSLRWELSLAGAGNYAKARGIAARFLVIRNHDGCPSKFQALRKGK